MYRSWLSVLLVPAALRESKSRTYRAAARLEGENVDPRGKDVDIPAIVGVLVARIVLCRATDGAHRRLRGRGKFGRILVLVASRDAEEHAATDEVCCGLVESYRGLTTEAQVGDDAVGAPPLSLVPGHILQAGDDGRVGAGALVVEDLDAKYLRLLGDAVRRAADGARHVRTVSVAVALFALHERDQLLGSAVEILYLEY